MSNGSTDLEGVHGSINAFNLLMNRMNLYSTMYVSVFVFCVLLDGDAAVATTRMTGTALCTKL